MSCYFYNFSCKTFACSKMNEASFLLLRKNDLNVKKTIFIHTYKGLKGTVVTRHILSGRSFEVTSTLLEVKYYLYLHFVQVNLSIQKQSQLYSCNLCLKPFKLENQLIEHNAAEHPNNTLVSTSLVFRYSVPH